MTTSFRHSILHRMGNRSMAARGIFSRFSGTLSPLARTSSELSFSVLFLMEVGHDPVPIRLKALCHPGDDGEPVLTIMLPDGD